MFSTCVSTVIQQVIQKCSTSDPTEHSMGVRIAEDIWFSNRQRTAGFGSSDSNHRSSPTTLR
eukprot:1729076-Heterocapsa_arctica.AAC.1